MKLRISLLLTAALLGCGGGDADSSGENVPESDARAGEANASAGDAEFDVQLAECKHAPDAGIYNRAASQWRIEQTGDNSLHITVWRMKEGGATQFNLHRSEGDRTNEINTVEGGQKVGEGTVTITERGEGAQFDIAGKDQAGNDVKGRVACAKLVPLQAEGG